MNVPQLEHTVRRLGRQIALTRSAATDCELLRAFSSTGDHAAFGEILRRHGGLVRAVCRRVLGDQAGADDAWQATFLVLARRGSTLCRSGSLAGWLHGVAYRTALNERRSMRRRSTHEAKARVPSATPPEKQAAWQELQELVDAEVRRLPEHLREVFIRCCLENAGCNEIAAELRLNEGTVRSRLTRARGILRIQLERKGVCLTATLAFLAVSDTRVSASLFSGTAATVISTGQAVPLGIVSERSMILASEATRSIGLVPKLAFAIVLGVGLIGISFAQLAQKPADPPSPKSPPATPVAEKSSTDTDALPANALARFGSIRFRAGGSVNALAFDPTGKRLASWGGTMYEADQFALWEAESGREIRTDRTLTNTLRAFAWPSNGVGVAVVSEENSAHLQNLTVWEFSARKPAPLQEPRAGPPRVVGGAAGAVGASADAVAVSTDGKRIAVATKLNGILGGVLVLEAKPTTRLADLKQLSEFAAPPETCTALGFTPDGKRLVGFCQQGGKKVEGSKILVWNADGKISRTIDGPVITRQGSGLTFAVSNELAAVGLEDGDSMLIDLDTGKTRTASTAHKSKTVGAGSGTFALSFSPDGKNLASAGRDGMVRVCDVATGKVTREFGKHGSWPEAIAYSADGKRIASAGQDAVIRVWDPIAGKEAIPTGGHTAHVWRAYISADSKTVVTAGREDIRIWDGATGAQRRQIVLGGYAPFCRLSPDSKHLLAVAGSGADTSLKAWDLTTGAETTIAGFPKTQAASGFRFTPDGKTLIAHHEDKLSAWAWLEGKKLWAADMPKPTNQPGINQVNSIAVSPDGTQFITVANRYWFREEKGLRFGYGADGIVDLWDTATGKPIRRLVESDRCFRPGMYAVDGSYIHSGGGTLPGDVQAGAAVQTQANLCVIDPLTGRKVREFGKPGRADGFDSGYTVALSADGKVLFRATGLGEVHAFEVASGSYRTAFAGHKASVLALDTPSDVRRLVSGSLDTTALLWNVGFGGKKGEALSADERAKQWEVLTDPDGAKAYDAMVNLAADPDGFLSMAKAELKPVAVGPTADDLAPIFRDLDGKTFAIREAASAKLDKFGEGAIALARARLEVDLSAEVRYRLKRFLEKCDGPGSMPTRLRQARAVELLEHLGTADAKALLEKVAKGGASYMTSDAAGALKRIQQR